MDGTEGMERVEIEERLAGGSPRYPQIEERTVEKEDVDGHQQCGATTRKTSEDNTRHYEWNHEEIVQLIELWAIEDCLYNMRSAEYKDKNERANALLRIQKKLEDSGIYVTVKDIGTKMHGLRVYYGATRNKLEATKKRSLVGATSGTPKVKWIYFESLSFLQDFFHPREKCSTQNMTLSYLQNSEEANSSSQHRKRRRGTPVSPNDIDSKEGIAVDTMISDLPYTVDCENREASFAQPHVRNDASSKTLSLQPSPPPTNYRGKHIQESPQIFSHEENYHDSITSDSIHQHYMKTYGSDTNIFPPSTTEHLEVARSLPRRTNETSRHRSSEEQRANHGDHLFCDMLAGQLQAIPDGESKEVLKYEIYGLVLRKRFLQRTGF